MAVFFISKKYIIFAVFFLSWLKTYHSYRKLRVEVNINQMWCSTRINRSSVMNCNCIADVPSACKSAEGKFLADDVACRVENMTAVLNSFEPMFFFKKIEWQSDCLNQHKRKLNLMPRKI